MLPNSFGRVITKIAFRFRLTDEEFLNILDAADLNRGVRAWIETFKMADSIDLGDIKTTTALYQLRDAGLLTSERVTEILSADIQLKERP